jgi:hypothetical protein
LVTPVKAEVTNRLRDAIIAIQAELGTQPSGTYSTVRARLDALRNDLETLRALVEAGGGGTGSGGAPSPDDKDQIPLATGPGDGYSTGLALTNDPFGQSYVSVFINGLMTTVGNGSKALNCYFSADGGTTAKPIASLTAGDELYWNGATAGFDLDASDRVDFDYDV